MKATSSLASRLALSFLACLLLAIPALAAPPAETVRRPALDAPRSPISAAEGAELLQALSKRPTVASDLLLIELPAGTPAGRHDLDATFFARGKRLFTERLAFETVRGGGARTIELLAWHPQMRAEVLKLAQQPDSDVKVTVVLDAGSRVLPLQRLLDQTKVLQQIGFEPLATRLQGGPAAPDIGGLFAKDQAECLQSCSDVYDQCTYGCSVYACIQECQYNYNVCASYCPPDCTGPTVREYTVTSYVSYVPVGESCFYESIFHPNDGTRYVLLYVTKKHETHRETTYCDGSKTDEVIEVTYSNSYCWVSAVSSCSPPSGGYAYNYNLCQ